MKLQDENGDRRAVLVRTLEIPATDASPTEARRWLDAIPELRPLGQLAFDVRLLVTELVANSVRHAGLERTDRIIVMLELSASRIRVEVRDPGDGFAFPLREQERSIEGGRGLQIVAAISSRWGIERSDPIAVWFEIDLEPPPRASTGGRVPRASVRGLVP